MSAVVLPFLSPHLSRMIRHLEETIEKAKRGEVKQLLCVFENSEKESIYRILYRHSSADHYKLLGMIEDCKLDIRDDVNAE